MLNSHIGKPLMEESICLLPDSLRFYCHRLLVYIKLKDLVPFYDVYQLEQYQSIIDMWTGRIEVFLHNEYFSRHHNFDWDVWRQRNPVYETSAQWVQRHNIVPDFIEYDDDSVVTQPELDN